MKNTLCLLAMCLLLTLASNAQKKIVVMGSSTAAGTGSTHPDSSWVGRLQKWYRRNTNDGADTVIYNIAWYGQTTYSQMPTGWVSPVPNRPDIDPDHNVTKALSFYPDAVIINLPSNDVANLYWGAGTYNTKETMDNFRTMAQAFTNAGITTYITTTQPRDDMDFTKREMQRQLVDSINNNFGVRAINFWDPLVTTNGLYNIKPELKVDDIHVNNTGHRLLFEQVITKPIVEGSGPQPPPTAGRIEAENYSSQSGTQTEGCSDLGGGLNVGYIDFGDWLEYSLSPSQAGQYTLRFRISTPNSSAQFLVKNSSGSTLATLTLPNTGGWQSWQTVTASVTLPAGTQTLRLQSSGGGGWNINWLEYALSGSAQNLPPTANAGADRSITLPANSVSITGTGTDPDGSIAAYSWTQVSGPSTASITGGNTASATFSNLVQGSYTFRLAVTDNSGAAASDDVIVTVNPAPSNPPTGTSIHIEAENYSAQSGTQTEGTSDIGGGQNVGYIDNGDWMDYAINTPAAGTYTLRLRTSSPWSDAIVAVKNASGTTLTTITLPNTGGWQSWQTATASITLPQGTQTIRLQSVSSGGWNINWLEVASSGTPAQNIPPTANAGVDKTITLPTNNISVSGSGTDPDGSISAFAWSQVSGPNTAAISGAAAANATFSGLIQGSYTFRLTVTDNSGASAFDDVVVTVNPAPSNPPTGTNIHIEAENYSSQSGTQTEGTSDVGGGLNVGYVDAGDWLEYAINLPSSGVYTLRFRMATQWSGGGFSIKNSAGTVLTTLMVPNTGGWQSWQTLTTTINLPAGSQTLRLQSLNSSGWNINWLEIISGTGSLVSAQGVEVTAETTSANGLSVYPNPASSDLTLKLPKTSGRVSIQIYTSQGILLRQQEQEATQALPVSVRGLSAGSYMIVVTSGKEKWTTRFIKR